MNNFLKGYADPEYRTCVDIILKCYFMFSLNPDYFLKDYVYCKNFEEDPVFFSVAHCIVSYNEDIRKTVFAFAWSFLEDKNMAGYDPAEVAKDPEHQVFTLFMHLGKLAQLLVQKVTQNELTESQIIEHLNLVKSLMKGRCMLAEQYQFGRLTDFEITTIEPAEIRFEISNVIEMSMLILILSKNTKVCKLALEILNFMVEEAIICENLDYPESSCWTIVNNFSMYSDLSSSSYVITGAIAVHKRLYQSLQNAKANTRAIIDAWKIINLKWKTLTETLKSKSTTEYDLTRTWRAYSGFLASTVSAWIVYETENPVEGKLSKSSKQFLLETLDLLTDVNSSYLRETSREILSRDTNHSAYHFIFTTLEEKLKKLSQDHSKLSETDFLLLEQSVLFLRAIIEYINDGEVYLAVDITSLALSIVKKLDALTLTERVIKLRIMYSGLVSSISKHKDSMNMKHDLEIRNEIAMIFCNWLDHNISYKYTDEEMDSVFSSETNHSDRKSHIDKERLQKDCIVALIDSLAGVTLKLAIQVPYGTHEKDIYDTKTTKFSVIFMILVRLLEKCRAEESNLRGSLMLGDRLETVKNKTIESLSKILDVNVDIGLKMAFPLAMHEDAFIRVSFIKILDNILSHSSGSKNSDSEDETYQMLSDFLIENIPVAVSLCDVFPATEVDEFSTAILSLFDSRNNSLGLVKTVITREVERADTPIEILRRNSVATKILSIYAHSKGVAYLHAALGPFIQEMIDNPSEYTFETNPDRIPEDQTVEENVARFLKTLNKLLDTLENSMNYIPRVFREICRTIATTADSRYIGKSASVNALSAFFFLRFICPSLVTPENDILSDGPPSREVKRALLILAKMVQNLAYGSGSFVKISIFKIANISFEAETAKVVRILTRLTDIDEPRTQEEGLFNEDASSSSSTSDSTGVLKAVDKAVLETIHRFLYNHWEDVNHRMQAETRMKKHTVNKPSGLNTRHTPLIDPRNNVGSNPAAITDDDKDFRISQKLTLIVRNLGRPKAPEAKHDNDFNIPNAPTFAPRLREFLERNSRRDMGAIIEKHIIHEGLSREGMPLLILTAKNYFREKLDTELVVCRFFQVVSKMMNQKFCLFYDATGMTPENLLPASANSVISMLAPDLLAQNCVGVYLYNVPDDMVSALRNSFRPYQTGSYLNPMTTRYQFLSSRDILSKFNLGTLNLDPVSERVATDTRVDFKGVYIVNIEKKHKKQVTLRLGNEYLQIHSDEPFQLSKGVIGYSNNVFHISDVTRVELSSAHPGEIIIVIGSTRSFTLRCGSKSNAHEIARSIASAKSRLPKTWYKFNNNGDTQLYQTLESSLGSFLNVSFSSLCSTNSSSKTAAYNLLATVQSRFKLDLGGVELVRGRGIKLPANVFLRVQKYSASIANSRPELTFDMIEEMFPAFQTMSHDNRQGALMYISPWVKGIAEHIHAREPEKFTKGTTARIIRQFLELSIGNDQDYMYMLQGVWPLIITEQSLLPILIEEVLSFVLENNFVGTSGTKMDSVIAILTAHQSLEATEMIMTQILEITMQAACVKDNSLVNHPQWKEIVVLVSIMAALMFENPKAADKYCAKFCFIVEMFLYTGPYSFRQSLYNLLVNMVHSFLYNDQVSGESLEHLTTLWKELTSSKGNMIFGTSGEMKNVPYDYPVTKIMFQIEACSTMLAELIRCVSTGQKLEHYHEQFGQLCLQLCSERFSIFQSRAIVALGCSSRIDVSDEVVTTVLEVFYDALSAPDTKIRTELITCCAFCISRLANGLRVDSKYYGYLFWIALALLNTRNVAIFGYGLQLLQTVVKSLDDYGVFKQMSMSTFLMSSKEEFRDQWACVERIFDISFSRQYFEHNLSSILLIGMIKSITRAATMATFDTLLTISARNHQYREGPLVSESSHNGASAENSSILSGASGAVNNSLLFKYKSIASASCGVTSNTTPNSPFSSSAIVSDFDGVDDISGNSLTVEKEYPSYMVYLFFLFLGARSRSDLRDYLWIAGYPEDQTADQEIPVPVQRFLTGKTRAIAALYMGAIVFNEVEDEDLLGYRYLEILKYIGSVSIRNYFRLYFVVRPKIKRLIDVGPNMETIKVALECAKTALFSFDELQKPVKYITELNDILSKAGMGATKCSSNCNLGGINGSAISSDKVFFQERPTFSPMTGNHNVNKSISGNNGHGQTSTVNQSSTSSTATSTSLASNAGSAFSTSTAVPPHGYKHTSMSQGLHQPLNVGSNSSYSNPGHHSQLASSSNNGHSYGIVIGGSDHEEKNTSYPDQQLSIFIAKVIEVAKSQCHKASGNMMIGGFNDSRSNLANYEEEAEDEDGLKDLSRQTTEKPEASASAVLPDPDVPKENNGSEGSDNSGFVFE